MAGHIALNTKEVLGAVGVVSSFLSALLWIFIQSSRAITSQVAYAYGQGKLSQVKGLVAQILLLSLGISLLSSIFSFVCSQFILERFYDAEGTLLEYCLDYFHIRVWGFPLTLLTLTIHSIFRGFQNTSWSMYISILGGVINLVFNYIFVYIFHWDIKGLAWASLLAQGTMFVVSVIIMYQKTPFKFFIVKGIHPKFLQSLRMSADLLIRSSMLQGVLYFSFLKATLLGTDGDHTIVATHTLLNQVWGFSTFLFDGYCNAGGLISGRLYSTRQYESIRELVRQLFYVVLGISIAISLIYFLLYYQIGTFMTENTDISSSCRHPAPQPHQSLPTTRSWSSGKWPKRRLMPKQPKQNWRRSGLPRSRRTKLGNRETRRYCGVTYQIGKLLRLLTMVNHLLLGRDRHQTHLLVLVGFLVARRSWSYRTPTTPALSSSTLTGMCAWSTTSSKKSLTG